MKMINIVDALFMAGLFFILPLIWFFSDDDGIAYAFMTTGVISLLYGRAKWDSTTLGISVLKRKATDKDDMFDTSVMNPGNFNLATKKVKEYHNEQSTYTKRKRDKNKETVGKYYLAVGVLLLLTSFIMFLL